MHVTARENAQLRRTVELLAAELAQPQIGTTAAINSIVDLLLVQFVRAWLARHPQERSGSWLGAMRDPVVRDALACVHAQPGHPGPRRPWPPRRASPGRRCPGVSGPLLDRRRART
ncbi:cupin domain-containing protein [Streptomyces sp. M19]